MADETVAAAYALLLQRHHWRWFATLTFSPTKSITDKWTGQKRTVDRFHPLRGMHLEAADKAWRWWTTSINRQLYGRNWIRNNGGLVWARGQEFHKSGRVHFHAVLAAHDGDLNKLASRYHWHELWFREFGRNQVEEPRNQDEITEYVSKYVAKDGEVDLSRNFGKVEPYRLFDGWQDKTSGVLAKPELAERRTSLRVGQNRDSPTGVLSLTLPVRSEFNEQKRFTDQTFFEINKQE